MNRSMSLYLDCVRFLAALAVVVTHLIQRKIFPDSIARFMPDLGREAVIVFFVLSGFVIAYTTERKTQDIRQYVIARLARVYSVAVPVLLMAFICMPLVEHLSGVLEENHYQYQHFYVYFPFHLLFGGQLWKLEEVPPGLIPYWSLDFEVWYYVLFACVFFLRGFRRLLAAGLALCVMGYKLWLLLPIWVSGVILYRLHQHIPMRKTIARVAWFVTLVAIVAYKGYAVDENLRALGNSIWPFPKLPLTSADRYVADYVVMVIVLANFYFANQAQFEFSEWWGKRIRLASSYTFTLYMVHALVITAWIMMLPATRGGWSSLFALCALIAGVTYVLAMLTEQRKDWFAAGFTKTYDSLAALRHS